MELYWHPNYEENRLTFEIDNLLYTTVDGGQNIDKFENGVFVKRLRQHPTMPADWIAPSANPPIETPGPDEWLEELDWLLETYPEQLGKKYLLKTYRERDGSLTESSHVRGHGVNNQRDLISVNRLGMLASIQERWDWDTIAYCITPQENSSEGIEWSIHKETKELWRHGRTQNCPCHVFPVIYPPVKINSFWEDVKQFDIDEVYFLVDPETIF